MSDPIAFYCISSELYFPGAVGLVNSLRLQGHDEPIYLLDCGLTPEHRELLAREVTIVPGPASTPPYLLKTIAPATHPAETMVLIDVDMVVTRPLTPLIEQAAAGHVLAVKDNLDRFVPEWGELLGIGDVEPGPYVTSGLVFGGGAVGTELIRHWHDLLSRVEYERSWFGRDEPGYPFAYLDQDVLNAILRSPVARDELVTIGPELAPVPPFHGLEITDARRLRCRAADGTEPYVIHQFVRKPWAEPMYHGIYSKLLRRLWLADDVAIRLDEGELPRRLRRGWPARLERRAVDVVDLARWYSRDVIPERLAARRGRPEGER